MKHRLNVAGSEHEIFTDDAISAVYRYSMGVPRLINTICDNALLEGYLFKTKAIDASVIKAVAIDLGLNGEEKK
jgi:type II secretory pathway predicted ATPase ExeA